MVNIFNRSTKEWIPAEVGMRVFATITGNGGYYQGSYKGTIVGFTKNRRIKIKRYDRIRCHASHNVEFSNNI